MDNYHTTPQLFPTGSGMSIFGPRRTSAPTAPEEEYQGGRLKRFTLFPNLPLEVRFEIWRFAMPARMIEVVDYKDEKDDPVPRAPKAPTIFFVCREARIEVMKACTPVMYIDGPGSTYIDLQKDILCFRDSRTHGFGKLDSLPREILESIHRIAASSNTRTEPWAPLRSKFKAFFPGLSEILVAKNVLSDGTDEAEREIVGFEDAAEVEDGTFAGFLDWNSSRQRQLEEAAWDEGHPGVPLPSVKKGMFILGKRYHARAPAQTPWMPNYRQFFE